MLVRPKMLHEARDRFRALLERPNTPERDWQQLFSDCPTIFSSALPVRIHPDDIRPLARPGKAESDFVFFANGRYASHSFGVIELKRPETRLIRIPRRDVLSLSADASDAIAQGRKYASELKAKLIIRPDTLFAIGNDMHVFIIAGMSSEIAQKITNEILRAQFDELLPPGCRIIPFDTLLSAFESRFLPRVHILNTWVPQSHATFARFLSELESAYSEFKPKEHWGDMIVGDDAIQRWFKLEEEYLWLLGPSAKYKAMIPANASSSSSRTYYDQNPRWELHPPTRSKEIREPSPFMFLHYLTLFVEAAVNKGLELGISCSLPAEKYELMRRKDLTPRPSP